jgi:hypothetical protein
VPLIDGIVTMAYNNHLYLTVMQDSALSHRNLLTLDELHKHGSYTPYILLIGHRTHLI